MQAQVNGQKLLEGPGGWLSRRPDCRLIEIFQNVFYPALDHRRGDAAVVKILQVVFFLKSTLRPRRAVR
jgi:hypothetical protein